jgi:hypothetical protein
VPPPGDAHNPWLDSAEPGWDEAKLTHASAAGRQLHWAVMDATPARRLGVAHGATWYEDGSGRLVGWIIAGGAACCLAPILAVTGVGALFSAFLAPSAGWAITAVSGGAMVAYLVSRLRRQEGPGQLPSEGNPVCRLPPSDRAQRTADFRALFVNTLVDRVRLNDGVRWTLRALGTTEAESRRLAALEARCCDGIRFDVVRHGDHIHWQISGPGSATTTLDALYDLPVLVRDEQRVSELWATLDAAACGPRRSL